MSSSKFIVSFSLLLIFNVSIYSQENCKVLIPAIAENYIGKCKKGLAHGKGEATGVDQYKGQFSKGFPEGKGTYTWANGDIYKGRWEKGKRNGEGVHTYKINGKDSILSGIWESDFYKGPKPKAPVVKDKTGVSRYSFNKQNDDLNTIEIKILRGGLTNSSVSGLVITSSSGDENGLIIENIVYPVKVSVSYTTTAQSLQPYQYQVSFKFEISDPGKWLVTINN